MHIAPREAALWLLAPALILIVAGSSWRPDRKFVCLPFRAEPNGFAAAGVKGLERSVGRAM